MLAVLAVLPDVISAVPDDDDVVAGWTAVAVFGGLALAVVVLGFSLTRRLKNVERAAEQGLYDPSDPKRGSTKPARGLAAARQLRAQAAAEEAGAAPAEATETTEPDGPPGSTGAPSEGR